MYTRSNPRAAIALMVLASVLVAGTSLLAKALGTDALGPALHPTQVSQGRFLFAFVAVAATFAALRRSITAPPWRLHVVRTVTGWLGVTLMFAAAARMPLSDATAINFLFPVFAMILAAAFLGESVGRIRWTAAAIALLGALVLLRPGPGTFQPAALIALASAFVIGCEVTLLKRLSGMEHPLQILLINNGIGLCIATLAMLAFWQPPSAAQWGALAALGVAMACAQFCFVSAMARADASFLAPVSYTTLAFAALYDWAIFSVVPDGFSLLGAAIILSGAATIAWREARHKRKPRRA